MFGKDKKTSNESPAPQEPNAVNMIVNGTKIVGEITANNDIRIDGHLKGNLTAKGRLVIGQTGMIIGDIKCKNADISGKVEGTISVSELLSLKSTSNIQGEIVTNKLAIEPGAIFTGTCNMSNNPMPKTPMNSNARRTASKQQETEK